MSQDESLEKVRRDNEFLRKLLAEAEQEKRALQEQIQQTRAEWEGAFNAITDRVFVEDDQYSVIRANAAVLRDYDLSPEKLFGKKCFQVFTSGLCN